MALSQSDTAKFAMAVKNARPDITDEELSALVKEAGDVNDDPVKSQALAMKMLPQLNTQLADPYAGAGHTAADSMRQFSPEQLKAAYAQQQAAYQQNQPSRAIGGILAGGSGSADVMNKNKADWDAIDKQNMLQSIDQQVALQDQATKGLAGAKSVQDMAQTAGKYSGTQLEQQQKIQGTQFTLDQQKRMNDPNSNETALAKSLILSQVGSMDNVSKAQMQKIVSQPGVTAQQLLPAMAQWAPAAQKAFMEKVNAGKTVADTAKAYADASKTGAEIPGVVAEGRIGTATANTIAPSVQQERDRESLAILKSEYDKLPDGHPDKASVFREITRLVDSSKGTLQIPQGMNMSVSGGKASLTPSPLVTGAQTAGATEDATGRNQSAVSTKYGLEGLTGSLAKQSADAVKAGKASATGSIANWVANLTPGESERVRTDINKLVDAKIAYGTAAGSNPIKDRDAEVARIMKLSPSAFQNEVLNSNQEVARNEARQKAYTDYIQKNGSPTGFDDSKIKGATYMYNPSTGANALVNPAKVDQYRKQGFVQLNELNR
jgi:hypothetical protein